MANIGWIAGDDGVSLKVRLENLDSNYTNSYISRVVEIIVYPYGGSPESSEAMSTGEFVIEDEIPETEYEEFPGLSSGGKYSIKVIVSNVLYEDGDPSNAEDYYQIQYSTGDNPAETLFITPALSVTCDSSFALIEITAPLYYGRENEKFPFDLLWNTENFECSYYISEYLDKQENDVWYTYRACVTVYYNSGEYYDLPRCTGRADDYPLPVTALIYNQNVGSYCHSNTDEIKLLPSEGAYLDRNCINVTSSASSITASLFEYEDKGFPVYTIMVYNSSNEKIGEYAATQKSGDYIFEDLEADTYKIYINVLIDNKQPGYFTDYYTSNAINYIANTTILSITISAQKAWGWTWTAKEQDALENGGAVNTLTCKRMNLFIEQIDLMLQEKKGEETSDYTDIYQPKLEASLFSKENDNDVLTATKFNNIRYCIGVVNSTGIKDKNPGEEVLGEYFLTLAEKLNEIELE